ncbi:MAG: hemerythrin family protein [Rhodospirillaceae bacterium]|nr:hemerythrin family protein [Rhodospirillaceae bacterium]
MHEIKWLSAYQIGNDKIDEQHEIFLSLVNKLAIDVRNGEGEEQIHTTFSQIVEFAAFHFSDEERLMQEHHFPEYETHKRLHEKIIQTLGEYFVLYQEGQLAIEDLVRFIVNWFARHTVCEDSKIGNFIAERSVARAI